MVFQRGSIHKRLRSSSVLDQPDGFDVAALPIAGGIALELSARTHQCYNQSERSLWRTFSHSYAWYSSE